jgi:hypothetical protein
MGLAPSENRENLRKSVVAQVRLLYLSAMRANVTN